MARYYHTFDLTETHWKIITLLCRDGLTPQEVADELGYRLHTIYRYLSSIYNRLNSELGDRDIEGLREWYRTRN